MNLYFLSLEDILEIHLDQINRYGGSKGIRDRNLLLSAIAQPQATYEGQYLHATMEDKAAAYLFHICQNHPFIDGNKRVAVVSTLMFLALNDGNIDYSEIALEKLAFSVAQGKVKKTDVSNFLCRRLG